MITGLLFAVALSTAALDGAAAIGVVKRNDTVTPTPLSTILIPLTVNSDQRYVVGVNMSSDPDTQRFKFALAANTGYTAVAAQGCNNCSDTPSYNPSLSSTAEQLQRNASFSVGSASFGGPLYKENCGLHESNGTAWQYNNQTIIAANSTSTLFTNVTSGLAGLGTLANGASGDFLDTIYGQWLDINPTHNNFSFGMDLKPPKFTSDSDTGSGGILHWVVPDSSAYQGTVTWATPSVSNQEADVSSGTVDQSGVDANTNFTLPESDWTIELDGWAASISGTSVANSTKVPAIIELYYPDIYFPQSQATLFYTAVSGATQLTSLVGGAETWSVPCSASLSVSFVVQGESFPLDSTALIQQQNDGSCIGTIKGWPDPNVKNFLLGSSFISQYYVIFVIGRPGSGVSNQIGFANKSSSSSTNIGAIVGGAVGGTAGVAILVGLAFWLGRRSKRRPIHLHIGSGASEKDHEKVSIFTDPQHSQHASAQYALVNSLGHSGPGSATFSTPPHSARSASSSHPLLPEPYSPAFVTGGTSSFPNTPNTPYAATNFLSIHPSTVSGDGYSPTGASAGQITYNRFALANATASQTAESTLSPSNQYGISPYVVPAASDSSSGLPSKTAFRSQPSGDTQEERLVHIAPAPSESTADSSGAETAPSTGALIEPFVLEPAPRARVSRYERKGSDGPGALGRADSVPAPPPAYSVGATSGVANATSPISPTLVEYAPSTEPARSRPTTGAGL